MTDSNGADLRAIARQLHGWGAAVTAIKAGTKRPGHKWERWQSAPQTRDEMEGLPWRGAAAAGVVNGSGAFRVFDLDAVKDARGAVTAAVPEAVVVELLAALGLPDDYQWSYASGSGAGWGVVIRCHEDLPAGWAATKGVYTGAPRDGRAFGHLELRWSSGQTVIDGAHPTGPGYRWRRGERPFVPPAELPARRVAAAFLAIAEPAIADAPAPVHGNGSSNGRYGAKALASAFEQVASTAPGGRNNQLYRQTAGLVELVNGGALARPEVEQAMATAAVEAGLRPDEAGATIASAFRRVQGSRGPAERNGQRDGAAPGGGPARDLRDYRPEDGGILDAWMEWRGDAWRYAAGFDEWYEWTGTHWAADMGGLALKAEIADLMDDMNRRARLIREETESDREREQMSAYVNATKRTAARVASVEGLARLRRFVPADQLDAASLLNLANRTLDLQSLDLRPHDPDDLLTYCLPYDYDPNASAPNWERVLARIDPEVAAFLQEFAGYALTPDTQHETAIWLYGPPGRGASTLLAGWQAMLGPKATSLGLADVERNRFALANLPGRTLAVATEQPANYLSATHVLNALISGEPVTVDRKYREAITITPRAKLAWAMNELPRVNGASNGIFRRVKVVSFPSIPEHERRPELKAAVQTEGAGILNWALEGLQRLRERGRFQIPAAIEAASREFAEKNDIPSLFVAERCDLDPSYSVGSQELYDAYRLWCDASGHRPQSITSIADDWARLGFERVKTRQGMVWNGLKVRP